MSVIVRGLLKNYRDITDENVKMDLDIAISSVYDTLTSHEMAVVELTKNQFTLEEIGERLGIGRTTVYRKFIIVCDKIAREMGQNYSDNKILDDVRERLGRNLTDDETIFCRYMIKNYGKKINNKLSIFNFRITKDGKVTTGESKK